MIKILEKVIECDAQAEMISHFILKSFDDFVAPGYSDEGRREFKKYAAPNAFMDRRSNHRLIIAEVDGELAGVIEIREMRHIALLFVAREFQRRGIAKALFNHAEESIRHHNPDCIRITVNSAPGAVDVYRKLGFQADKDEQCINGIRFTPMSKTF